jgi:YD repeat-containing protein
MIGATDRLAHSCATHLGHINIKSRAPTGGTSVNLVHLPYGENVNNSSGNPVAENEWRYDEPNSGTPTNDPGIVGHSSNYGTGYITRGNVTDTYAWLGSGTYLNTESAVYDIAGNLTYRQDADGNALTYAYNGDGQDMYAFPTSVRNGLGYTTSAVYAYNAGKPASVTDASSNTTQFVYNDGLDRVTQISEPSGAQSNLSYYPNAPTPYGTIIASAVAHDQTTAGDKAMLQSTMIDGLGRPIAHLTQQDASHYIVVGQSYDAAGRVSSTANPSVYSSTGSSFSSSDGLNYATALGYDTLGRTISVKTPDGNTTATAYSGNAVTVTDPTTRANKQVLDGLGRVSNVYEDVSNTNLQTQYTYNAAGSLTGVLKCSASGCSSGQSRSFVYDAAQRLIQANNPESGIFNYSFTLSGANHIALQSRTDPRGYTTTYGHDAMDELTGLTYNDGTTNATFSCSPIGNLSQSSNGNVVNHYTSFDGDGRITASNVQMQGVSYTFTYGYDLAGDLIKEIYPSGRTVNTAFDITPRPLTVNGVAAGTTTKYVQSSGYYPDGHVQFWQYASNLWNWQNVDNMLRPWQGWATMNNNGNNWMFYVYNGFDTNSDVIGGNEGFGPAVPFNSMTFFDDQYEYDGLKRLFKITDTNYARQYSWDVFGNPSVTSGLVISGLVPQSPNGSNPLGVARDGKLQKSRHKRRRLGVGRSRKQGQNGNS